MIYEEKKIPDIHDDMSPSDEAENLAWDAFRKAEEAKKAAERLAEIKASLGLSGRITRASVPKEIKEDETRQTLTQEEPAATESSAALVVHDRTPSAPEASPAPVPSLQLKLSVDPTTEAKQDPIPSPTNNAEENVVTTQVAPAVVQPPTPTSILKTTSILAGAAVVAEPEEDLFVRMLDAMGVDKMCGVDEMVAEAVRQEILSNNKPASEMAAPAMAEPPVPTKMLSPKSVAFAQPDAPAAGAGQEEAAAAHPVVPATASKVDPPSSAEAASARVAADTPAPTAETAKPVQVVEPQSAHSPQSRELKFSDSEDLTDDFKTCCGAF